MLSTLGALLGVISCCAPSIATFIYRWRAIRPCAINSELRVNGESAPQEMARRTQGTTLSRRPEVEVGTYDLDTEGCSDGDNSDGDKFLKT